MMRRGHILLVVQLACVAFHDLHAAATTPPALPSLETALASKLDLWGEAAMALPNGASYEFFAPLLPPPRYVNADFRSYPIVLSAPNAAVKARLISDGSGVNLRGGARSWNDPGVPFRFRVGPDELVFGTFRERLGEPTLAEGFLPIAEIRYRHASPVQSEGAVPLNQSRPQRPPEIYRVEAFASTDPALAEHGVVFVKFSLARGTAGTITVTLDDRTPVKFADGKLANDRGETLAVFDPHWKWERQRATARLTESGSATLAIATKPLAPSAVLASDYEAQRAACAATWRAILAAGMNVVTPEPRVNDAWRALVAQNFALIRGDRMHYSAGNQYDQLYEAEGTDAALAMLAWGYAGDTRRLLAPLLDFTRKGLEHHQAASKSSGCAATIGRRAMPPPCVRSGRAGNRKPAASSKTAPARTACFPPSAMPATSARPRRR